MNRIGSLGARGLGLGLAAAATTTASAQAPAPAAFAASPWFAAAVALAVVAIGLGAWLAARQTRHRLRLSDALREERARWDCLEPLLDVWLWRSGADHQLVSTRPPPGAPAADWSAGQPTAPLWERFEADDPGALRARLDAGAPFDAIAVRLTGTAPRRGVLGGRPFRDAAGHFAGYHGTFRETAPEPAAAAATAAAPVADAAADHEAFGFTVSHDLRAPIRVVEGFTRIVKEDYGRLLDRVGNDHLDRVLGAATRMNNMIDALLSLSKLSSQPLAREAVNLSQLAGFVADDLRRQWPERRVELEIEPNLLARGDPTLLRVVIENLLGNAWKYTAKAAQARITFTRATNHADTFTVADNGAGFDMRFAERLFGVFQRLHSASDFPGTGVGLASVLRIVRRHGGEIWGEAEVNGGARFHFSLPAGEPAAG